MMLDSPVVQSGILGTVVVGALLSLKPTALGFNKNGQWIAPYTPYHVGVLVAALWLAYQTQVNGKSLMLPPMFGAGASSGHLAHETSPLASMGAAIAATAQAGVAAGDTFFD